MKIKLLHIPTLILISISLLSCSKTINIGFHQKIDNDAFRCLMAKKLAIKDPNIQDSFLIKHHYNSFKTKKYTTDSFLSKNTKNTTHTIIFSWDDDDATTRELTSTEGIDHLKKEMVILKNELSVCIKEKITSECFTSNIENHETICKIMSN
jgi:hypothetical protein